MSDATVIDFPRPSPLPPRHDDYSAWLSWAECELSILGYDLSACDYDWQAAHAKGLPPEAAAADAAQRCEKA